jgi:hypothetical protein
MTTTVQGWAAWHPTKGYADEFEPDAPIAHLSLDGAARRVKMLNIEDGTTNRSGWRAVKVEVRKCS